MGSWMKWLDFGSKSWIYLSIMTISKKWSYEEYMFQNFKLLWSNIHPCSPPQAFWFYWYCNQALHILFESGETWVEAVTSLVHRGVESQGDNSGFLLFIYKENLIVIISVNTYWRKQARPVSGSLLRLGTKVCHVFKKSWITHKNVVILGGEWYNIVR